MTAMQTPRRWAFVDLETTGMQPARERVTEVAVIVVDADGDAVRVQEWSSLINPEMAIPAEIQWLTGITNDMVRSAPRFADVAEALLDLLHGALFVAHNARFDYGFLRAEFKRLGVNWHATTLCTVRLSRLLDADRGAHSLDALAVRYQLASEQRHRALGDARLIRHWIERVRQRHGSDAVEAAVDRVLARPSIPVHLAPDALDSIPHAPGVYLFYGLNAHPIYIGKAVDLAQRVAGHFNGDSTKAADARLAQEVRRIEWEETAGELGALLREAELVRTRLPAHNVALRRKRNAMLLQLKPDGRARYVRADAVPPETLHEYCGPFGSRASIRNTLLAMAREHMLCAKTLGLERGNADTPCFSHQLGRCRGTCVSAEPFDAHRERCLTALSAQAVTRWPFDYAVAVRERRADNTREAWHVFDHWCWLGSVATEEAARALAAAGSREFDPDVYRLAAAALKSHAAALLALPRTH